MPRRLLLAVPVVFVLQTLLVSYGLTAEQRPPLPNLESFPARVGNWNKITDRLPNPSVQSELGADRLLQRLYQNTNEASSIDFFVAWFQSQRGGKTQPHSPLVCLPGAGWAPRDAEVIEINTSEGSIRASRSVVTSGLNQQAVMLYWYQTPRRVLASEWEAKFWLIPDAFHDRRTDTTLVRIVATSQQWDEEEATFQALDFARTSYPILRVLLPD